MPKVPKKRTKRREPRLEWQSQPIEIVTRFFAESFSMPDGYKLLNHEAFVDPFKGEVVFKLFLTPL